MPGAFQRVYTDEQRDAVGRAALDYRVRPLARIVELAERGELLARNGEHLAPFRMPLNTARSYIANERRRRAGKLASALAREPAHTQAELVRARLMSIADHELLAVERELQTATGRRKGADMQRASRAAKVAREALALRAGSVLEPQKRGLNDQETQPPSAATPAMRRLAGERVQGQHPLSDASTNTNESDRESDSVAEALRALAENAGVESAALEGNGAEEPAGVYTPAPDGAGASAGASATSRAPRQAPRQLPRRVGVLAGVLGSHNGRVPVASEPVEPVVTAH